MASLNDTTDETSLTEPLEGSVARLAKCIKLLESTLRKNGWIVEHSWYVCQKSSLLFCIKSWNSALDKEVSSESWDRYWAIRITRTWSDSWGEVKLGDGEVSDRISGWLNEPPVGWADWWRWNGLLINWRPRVGKIVVKIGNCGQVKSTRLKKKSGNKTTGRTKR